MFVLANMWFQTLMRQFFFNIDRIVFNFISTMYDFLITIARTSVLSQADIADIAGRVYRLLAIFMVFKVTFSLIMYVVNPDDFSDKTKGVGKLSANIIISLGLLILTPYIFNLGYQLQTIILEDNSLATLIFGNKNQEATDSAFNSAGDSMAYITMSPFFTPNLGIDELSECAQLTTVKVVDSVQTVQFNDKCEEALSKMTSKRFDDQTKKNYVAGIETANLGIMFRQDMAVATDEDNKDFIIEYKYLFSTITGIIVILLLITFCMDVALRSIKLAFLQLIAPVPILSYVDPKSGKDGMFKKWYDMCFKTYVSLFIRLLALYFVAHIISRLNKMVDIVTGAYITNALIKIAIIIGALMFAKQLPKILEGLGIKLDGGFTLNPFKKMENEMIGGKKLAAFTKAVPAAGLAGAAAFGTNLIARKGNVFSAAAGALSATGRGLKGAVKGEKFGKNFTNSYNGAMKARTNREDRKSQDVGWFEMQDAKIRQAMGMHTKGESVKSASDKAKQISSVYTSMMSAAEGNDKATFTANVNGTTRSFGGIKGLTQFIEETKKTPINRNDYATEEAYLDALQEQQNLVTRLDDIKKERLNAIAEGRASSGDDATDSAIRSGYGQQKKLSRELAEITGSIDSDIPSIPENADAKTINGMAKGISNQITASEKASHKVTVDEYAAKKKKD